VLAILTFFFPDLTITFPERAELPPVTIVTPGQNAASDAKYGLRQDTAPCFELGCAFEDPL
jgi:hypothetical protein